LVLDPFAGSGTVGLAAYKLGRDFIGIEKEPAYVAIAEKRLAAARAEAGLFAGGC
jgi:modification methylase